MLTSSNQSNQYLRPDYLTPLPTTLDAKNSPLALLAQTCSAIGSDSPNPKLLANIEKSTKSHKLSIDSNRDKSSPNSNQSSLSNGSLIDHQQTTIKSSFKPYESSITNTMRERSNLTPSSDEQQQQRSLSNLGANYNSNSNNNNNSNTHHNNINSNNNNNTIRIKTPKTLHNGQQQQQQRCDSNQSATSQTRDSSPAAILNGGSLSSTSSSSRKTPQQHHQRDNNDSQSPHQQQRASSKDSLNNISLSQNSPNTNRIPNDLSKDITSLTKSSVMPNNNNNSSIPSSAASYFSGYPTGLSGFPMDLLTAGFMPHHPMMKAAALNSYFNYARPKGSGGGGGDPTAGMMPPICRDPYCTGCPTMSPHVLNKATGQQCPPSCQQCDSSVSKSYQQHSNAAAAYAHAQLAALAAASQLPYVCSWIAGDSAYCGKRYGTSDELFQHLRTHTASMPESMLNAVAASGLPPNHPLFQRTYPTPPLSPLSSARYHPYGKPSMYPPTLGPPSLAGLQIPQHPSLAPYFSPYSLYGPRLGASPSMHP